MFSAGSWRALAMLVAVLWMQALAGASSAPMRRHKLQVTDPAVGKEILASGGRLIADYGGYQLYDTPSIPAAAATNRHALLRDQYDLILLHARHVDTADPVIQAARHAVGVFAGKRLHLVQFAGPVQPAWREALARTGVEIVAAVPHNAYLVYGDALSLGRLQAFAATAPVQWDGPFLDEYRLHPAARATDPQGNPRELGTDWFAIQMVPDGNANAATTRLLEQLQLEPMRPRGSPLKYVNVLARLSATNLPRVAARPDVISIQPYFPRRKLCEWQDQIIAGNLAGNIPSGPGYLAWLASKGFTQQQFTTSGFCVDVADSGIDDGTTSPNHFGLRTGGVPGATSRVLYNRVVGTPNSGSTTAGCDGHGNLNAHIIAGYDNLPGFPFADSSGFHYGLGVCPFVRVGASVIFDPEVWTSPDYTNLETVAYQLGARISNNSWGGSSSGLYDIDAQDFDALTRDAQPAGSSGNQEMVLVFSAGNDGPRAQTMNSPGVAKNVLTVGAAENVHFFGGMDGSGMGDAQADNANDLLAFSSRGPCADLRHKPDLVAPGTHVSGGAPQAQNPGPDGSALSCFNGSGISGGTNGSNFFPPGQEFYTASSGTSHAAPGVSGGCALLRQYFLNQSLPSPSPAMTKAYLMNAARYLTGAYAKDTLWSDAQGMGEMDLGRAFDGTPRLLRDEAQADLFTASGQVRVFFAAVADTNKPVRVTLAWTDAPGSTAGNAYNNDLDLEVDIGGRVYRGNNFSGAYSVPDGSADFADNVESVFLPPGTGGPLTVTVLGTDINSDGVPGNAFLMDQDFALVVYNATPTTVPVITSVTATNVTVSFPSVAGLNYTLEYKISVDQPQWTALTPAVPGTGDNMSLVDTNAPSGSRFYRVLAR